MKWILTSILLVLGNLTPAFAQQALPPDREPFVEEVVGKLVVDLTFVTGNAHGNERGFALSFFGVDSGILSQVALFQPCTKRMAFEPTIERREDGSFQRTQLFCDAASIDRIRVDVASDQSNRMLTYPATRFQGTVLFDPNLRADWRTVEHADGTFSLSAEIFRHLIFTPASGPAIDLTHSALLTGRVLANEPVAAHAQVVMPAVTNNGLPLVANVRIDEAGNAVGTIEIDGTVIATIAGTGFELSFSWSNG